MGLGSALASLLLFLWISGLSAGIVKENCTNTEHQFENVSSVPGEVAMLNSTLLSPDVLNFTAVPYNITWYNSKTGQEMRNQTGQALVLQETLWFFNTTLSDAGEYVIIVRTPAKCYRQSMKLMVDLPLAGECGRPKKASQDLILPILSCPLVKYINKLKSYNITCDIKWYKGCEPIQDVGNEYMYWGRTILQINGLGTQHSGTYTCTLTFKLGGVTGSVSETIEATVRGVYILPPEIIEPFNEIIKAEIGSKFIKSCLVFVPSAGSHSVGIRWLIRNISITNNHPSARIYTKEKRIIKNQPRQGVFIELQLIISELRVEDFNTIYSCLVDSPKGVFRGNFTLLQTDPNIPLISGLVFGSFTALFIISITIYNIFRIDIVLWWRRVFQILYKNQDGKLYDAYVTYAQPDTFGFNEEVEKFALNTLPQMLENTCGYKLFIPGRDSLPGQTILDSIEENIQASHCVLLLYTSSTFIGNITRSNSNNLLNSNDGSDKSESKTGEMRQLLEHVTVLHRSLLEETLKVVLVELEQITPAQLNLFPESVRHLRKKQGAVCLWKNLPTRQRGWTCMKCREDEEISGKDFPLTPSLSPSSRFWKEIRYHMPVNSQRVV